MAAPAVTIVRAPASPPSAFGIGLGSAIGAMVAGALPALDAAIAQGAVRQGPLTNPEAFPLFARPGLMVPLIAGPILIGASVLGRDPTLPISSLRAAGVATGAAMLGGMLVNTGQAMDGRAKAGLPMFFPSATAPRNPLLACRSIGGPGYALCEVNQSASGQVFGNVGAPRTAAELAAGAAAGVQQRVAGTPGQQVQLAPGVVLPGVIQAQPNQRQPMVQSPGALQFQGPTSAEVRTAQTQRMLEELEGRIAAGQLELARRQEELATRLSEVQQREAQLESQLAGGAPVAAAPGISRASRTF